MALVIKHQYVSPKLDDGDPTMIQPQTGWNADHAISGSGWMIAGQVIDYLGHTIPSYLLECYGQSVAAATYPLLFAALVKQATVTFGLGTPGTVNWTGHGLPINSKVRFRTTGVLPTGIVANTDYFIVSGGYGANAFRISATLGGTEIALSGSPTGTQTGLNAQYGVSNDLATFTVPDLRGRVTAGLDTMGGTAAGRLTGQSGGVSGVAVGSVGGLETHTLTLPQSPAHTHNNNPPDPTVSYGAFTVTVNSGGAHTHTVTGTVDSGGAHTHVVTGNVDSGGAHTHAVNSGAGTTGSSGAHTPAGSIDSAANHTHSIDPPITATTAGGAGSSHTHSIPVLSGSTDTEAAHTHGDTFSAATTVNSGGAHSHTINSLEFINRLSDDGGRSIIQNSSETGGSGNPSTDSGGSHGHTAVTSISGSVSAGGSHSHTVTTSASTTGSGGGGADHTHNVDIAAFTSGLGGSHNHNFTGTAVPAHTHTVTIDSGGAHTHTFSSGVAASAGAHTHTFSSGLAASAGAHTHTVTLGGTITSAQADYATDSAGGGSAHNNVQPTFVLRKLVYVG